MPYEHLERRTRWGGGCRINGANSDPCSMWESASGTPAGGAPAALHDFHDFGLQ
ncbi:hypothetical protein ACIBL5_37660 [Streptomyces sp. NPDC050516]|uniref:hypothetical protein n=1 Tax=Streptomyces sp. NPDC050516 TaxID=3365621 RepID=UPI0037BA94C0